MRLSAHCYALTGFAYLPPWAVNAGFVAGRERTLVVDSGPTALAAATILGSAMTAIPLSAGAPPGAARGPDACGHGSAPDARRTTARGTPAPRLPEQ